MSDVNWVAVGAPDQSGDGNTIKYSKDGKKWENATSGQFTSYGHWVASKYSLFVPRIL